MNLLWHGNLISKRTKNHIIDMKQQKTSIKVESWFFGILDTNNSINNSTSDSQLSRKNWVSVTESNYQDHDKTQKSFMYFWKSLKSRE